MPETRIAPHVHLETDCHCPTITRPTEAERLQAELDRLRAGLADGLRIKEEAIVEREREIDRLRAERDDYRKALEWVAEKSSSVISNTYAQKVLDRHKPE